MSISSNSRYLHPHVCMLLGSRTMLDSYQMDSTNGFVPLGPPPPYTPQEAVALTVPSAHPHLSSTDFQVPQAGTFSTPSSTVNPSMDATQNMSYIGQYVLSEPAVVSPTLCQDFLFDPTLAPTAQSTFDNCLIQSMIHDNNALHSVNIATNAPVLPSQNTTSTPTTMMPENSWGLGFFNYFNCVSKLVYPSSPATSSMTAPVPESKLVSSPAMVSSSSANSSRGGGKWLRNRASISNNYSPSEPQQQAGPLRFCHSDASTIAADRTRARPGPGRPRRPRDADVKWESGEASMFLQPMVQNCPSSGFEATPAARFLFVNEGNPMDKKDGRHKNCKMLEKEARAKARVDWERQKQQQFQVALSP